MKNFFKKLMSSKSQSKYFSETVQRVGKNNAGFSLVELIVVIAIMAILAAVAVIGVSIYIPKAQEATDNELLGVLTDALVAACLSEGVDQRDITATIAVDQQTGKLAMNGTDIAIQISGTSKADEIADLFNDVVTDKNAKFNIIKGTSVKFTEGKFGWSDGAANTNKIPYGNGFLTFDDEDIANLKDSTFADMGMTELMTQLNQVTGLITGMTNTESTIGNIISGDSFRASAAAALGVDESQLDTKLHELTIKALAQQTPPITDPAANGYADAYNAAQQQILANATVLYTAQQTGNFERSEITTMIGNRDSKVIIDKLSSDDEKVSGEGMVQAAVMAGLYTSYVNSVHYPDPDNKPEVNITNVITAIGNDEGFYNYITNTTEGQKDLDAYLSSLNMINSSTNDPDAVSKLLIDGFADEELIGALDSTIGK